MDTRDPIANTWRPASSSSPTAGRRLSGAYGHLRPGAGTRIAAGIALAGGSPLGVPSRYRFSSRAGYVDTVPYGAFRRSLLESIGGFDETIPVHEDYELLHRIRSAGGRVYLDPRIRCEYHARATLGALVRQFKTYGRVKADMVARDPGSVRPRQLAAPLFVAALGTGLTLAPFSGFARRVLLPAVLVSYAGVLGLVVVDERRKGAAPSAAAAAALAVAAMHLSWGVGFLTAMPRAALRRRPAHPGAETPGS